MGQLRIRTDRKRTALRAAVSAGVLVVFWWLASYSLFSNPPLWEPTPADAVVVLGGASSERLPVGRQLVQDGLAPVLVLSHTDTPGNLDADRLCNRPHRASIVCFRPEQLTTRGEARAVARLAEDRGWDRVLVVTSRYHALRANLHLEQCSDAEIVMNASSPSLGVLRWLPRFIEEGVGVAAGLVRPACANPI